MINRDYAEYAWYQTVELLDIDSPTGFTDRAAAWAKNAFEELGFPAWLTRKGGVMVDLGGEDSEDALLLSAHVDTLGAMVAEVKGNGRLRLTTLGGFLAENVETTVVRIHTRSGKVYEGTIQLCNASLHVNMKYEDEKRNFDNLEVVIDEDVHNAEETRALGIEVGDFICINTSTRRTHSGYLKSRFLDDKLCAGALLGLAKYLKENNITLKRRTYIHLTVYEEVGHGAAASIPEGVTEMIAVDMGCVGDGLQCTERQVSICVKDSVGPYCYSVVGKLIDAAKAAGVDYALDVYPRYGSDADIALRAGNDIRHGLIGPGVYASHGYERSHMDGLFNTMLLLCSYLGA